MPHYFVKFRVVRERPRQQIIIANDEEDLRRQVQSLNDIGAFEKEDFDSSYGQKVEIDSVEPTNPA